MNERYKEAAQRLYRSTRHPMQPILYALLGRDADGPPAQRSEDWQSAFRRVPLLADLLLDREAAVRHWALHMSLGRLFFVHLSDQMIDGSLFTPMPSLCGILVLRGFVGRWFTHLLSSLILLTLTAIVLQASEQSRSVVT